MIKVKIGSTLNREEVIIPETTTIREALENKDIDYSTGSIHLDGVSLRAGDFDKTFADFGITEKCSLISVVKSDAA